jgi:hypothetical protein
MRGAYIPTCLCIVDPPDIVHATYYEVHGIWRPCQIVYFCPRRPAHVLHSPRLLILKSVVANCMGMMCFGGNPKENDSIVACRSKQLACYRSASSESLKNVDVYLWAPIERRSLIDYVYLMSKDIPLSALLHRHPPSITRTCQHWRAGCVGFTYSNVIISPSSCQSSLAVRLEVCGVHGGTQFMPIYQEGCCFHLSELYAYCEWAS